MAFLPSPESQPTLNVAQAVEAHLAKSPSGPDFTQATRTYCQTGVELALSYMHEFLPTISPDDAELRHALMTTSVPHGGLLRFATVNGVATQKVVIASVDGSERPVQSGKISKQLIAAAPAFNRVEYFNLLGPRNRYTSYETRLAQLEKLGVSEHLLQFFSVVYLTQIAKDAMVEKTKALLTASENLAKSFTADPEKYKANVVRQVGAMRLDEAYVMYGAGRIAELTSGLDPEQIALLYDIAFMRSDESDEKDFFDKLFKPIVEYVNNGDWEKALVHRDFLLRFSGKYFPDWRFREYQKTTQQRMYTSLTDVAYAIESGEIASEEIEFPESYHELAQIFQQTINSENSRRVKGIMFQSVGLSGRVFLHLHGPNGTLRFDPVHQTQIVATVGKESSHFSTLFFNTIYYGGEIKAESLAKDVAQEYRDYSQSVGQASFSLREYLWAMFYPNSENTEEIKRFIAKAEDCLKTLRK